MPGAAISGSDSTSRPLTNRARGRRRSVIAMVGAVLAAPAPAYAKPALLRLDGIGPLKLGMTRTAALETGWLAHRGRGCPLGGPPVPITYRIDGPQAPKGVRGSVEFVRGRLRIMSFSRGVRTATGVVAGRTTPAGMVRRYRDAGFSASSEFVATFQATFVDVRRKSTRKQVIGGYATGRVVERLAIPFVPTCD